MSERINYGKWTWSRDEESWPARDGWDTKEEAIAAAKEEMRYEATQRADDGEASLADLFGATFWVGRMDEPPVPTIDVDWLLEHLAEQMEGSEQGGEWAEGWPEVGDEGRQEFVDEVEAAVLKLLKKNDAMPSWFMLFGAEEHRVEGER